MVTKDQSPQTKVSIAWMIPELDLKNPSVRVRRYNVHLKLVSMGITSFVRSDYYTTPLYQLVGELMPYDIVIFTQIAQMDSVLMRLLKDLGKKIVFDHCENLFNIGAEDACMKIADTISCCSTLLAELTNSNGYANTVILRDPVEEITVDHKYEAVGRRLRAGFMGMGGNSYLVENLRSAVEKADYELVTITEWENATIKWTLENWHNALNTCDVVLCPQTFPAKSNIKVTTAMALGFPVIASPIRAYQEVICQDHNGYLCWANEEWDRYLILLKDEKKRRMIGEAAKNSVQEYTLEFISNQWLEMFKSL